MGQSGAGGAEKRLGSRWPGWRAAKVRSELGSMGSESARTRKNQECFEGRRRSLDAPEHVGLGQKAGVWETAGTQERLARRGVGRQQKERAAHQLQRAGSCRR